MSILPSITEPQHQAIDEDVDNLVPSDSKTQLPEYKTAFIQACMSASVLTFGTFTLKSGRESPVGNLSGIPLCVWTLLEISNNLESPAMSL